MYRFLIALFVASCGVASAGASQEDATLSAMCSPSDAGLMADPQNCGACNNVCRFPMQCYMGVCGAIPLDR